MKPVSAAFVSLPAGSNHHGNRSIICLPQCWCRLAFRELVSFHLLLVSAEHVSEKPALRQEMITALSCLEFVELGSSFLGPLLCLRPIGSAFCQALAQWLATCWLGCGMIPWVSEDSTRVASFACMLISASKSILVRSSFLRCYRFDPFVQVGLIRS